MSYQLALIDMDGTVYTGSNPVKNVSKGLDQLRKEVDDIFFLTNYAGTKRDSYSDKLEKMGIDASSEDVVTSGWLTAHYISQEYPNAEVYVLGEKDLKAELQDKAIDVSEACDNPDIVVVSNKHDLEYDDLKNILQNTGEDTIMLGTNPDETIPGDAGEIPGAGTIIQAVEAMTGKDVEIIGKPSRNAVKTVLEIKNADPEECIMIGDRLNTDILMGLENGMTTALVLTGVTGREDLEDSDIEPDFVLDSIAEIDEVL